MPKVMPESTESNVRTSIDNAQNARGTSEDRKRPAKKKDWRRREPTLRQWCITLGAIQIIWGLKHVCFLMYKFQGLEVYFGLQKYEFISHQKWFGTGRDDVNANFAWHVILLFCMRIIPGILVVVATAKALPKLCLVSVLAQLVAAVYTLGDYLAYLYYATDVFPTTKRYPGITAVKVLLDMMEDVAFRLYITFRVWRLYLEIQDSLNPNLEVKVRQSTGTSILCNRENCGCKKHPPPGTGKSYVQVSSKA